jgi:hypothetical protein
MPDVRQENNSKKTIMKKRKKASSKKKSSGGILSGLASNPMAALLNPRNQAGSMAEVIEKQAAAQKRQAEERALSNSPAFANPFQSLQDQLFGAVNNINVAPTPLEQLRKMAESQVAAQFDPMITALGQEMKTRETRAGRSQNTARDMYGALSKDYLSQLPEMTQQFAAEDAATNQRYDQAQQQMEAGYEQNANEQNAVLKQLGIQAAAPDASKQMNEDQQYFQNQAELDQQSAMSALNEQQMAQQNYQQNLGSNAKMAGANLASDIGQQLEDYMGQATGQMTQLRGQKGSALAALLAQLQQQDAERVSNTRQQEFDNMMKMFNFQLSAQDSMMDNMPKPGAGAGGGFGAEGTLTSGLPGAQNYLASIYPDQPIMAGNLYDQLTDVLQNKNVTQGKFVLDPGDPAMGKAPKYSDVGQEYMMDLLKKEFEKEGSRYGQRDINATMAALQAYLGKLR